MPIMWHSEKVKANPQHLEKIRRTARSISTNASSVMHSVKRRISTNPQPPIPETESADFATMTRDDSATYGLALSPDPSMTTESRLSTKMLVPPSPSSPTCESQLRHMA